LRRIVAERLQDKADHGFQIRLAVNDAALREAIARRFSLIA
jgi:hypothetical protein